MKIEKIFLLLFFLILSLFSLGQSTIENNINIIEESPGRILEDLNESGQDEIPEELQKLIYNPIDLNSDDLEIFVHFNILTRNQQLTLKEYISKNGKLIEREELQQIEGFTKEIILLILPYIKINRNEKKESSQQLTLRMQRKINQEKEFYSGSSEKILVRLKGRATSTINYSFTGEKDAGEEMFTKNKNGFDFNSLHVIYSGKSFVNKIIIGDFIAQYGQGLTLWQGLGIGGSTNLTGLYKSGRGTIPYSGTDENRFFRGIAFSMGKKNINSDVWISHHNLDANVITDSLNNEINISSMQTSGYHRSDYEKNSYHTQNEFCAGTSIKFSNKKLNVGIVSVFGKYDIPINSIEKFYNHFYFRGRQFLNTGIFYNYSYKNIFIFGENSFDSENTFAFLSGIILSLDPKVSLGLIYRNYPGNFQSLKSNAFGENTLNNNETGNQLGVNYKIFNSLTYSVSLDLFSFGYIKYRVDQPSHGFNFFNQLDFIRGKKFSAQMRIQTKMKQQNETFPNETFHQLSDNNLTSYRISVRMKLDNTWELAFRTECVIQSKSTNKQIPASSISQSLFYHPLGKSISANARYSIYNCQSFDTRIYEYENDLPGAFSIPFYYGRGSRFYINVNTRISRSINLSVRYSVNWLDNAMDYDQASSEIKIQVKIFLR